MVTQQNVIYPQPVKAHEHAVLPEPISVPWTMKPLESAACKLDILGDGRLHLSIVHDVLRGVAVAMDYTFERVAAGTLYRNSLTFGVKVPRSFRVLNDAIRRFEFDERRGRAWLKHNVEEVGNFEHFLPGLFAHARGASAERVYVIPGRGLQN